MQSIYPAPWSRSLVITSCLVTLLLTGISVGAIFVPVNHGAMRLVAWLPVLILAGAAPFVVRAYSVGPDAVLIRRLLWTTRLPIAGLESVKHVPDAMRGSLRICGNGGMYSFTGFFWNKTLGSYRAFVTDPGNTVVLNFGKKRIVLSPEDPAAFARELEKVANLGDTGL